MSKVKIEGHGTGTGTFTVTTPSSNTDRTITLPDSTDTLAVNSDVTNKLPLAGGSMTGNLVVGGGAAPRISITSNNANGSSAVNFLSTTNNSKNWEVGSNLHNSDGLEFTPSTANGNSTFTTPTVSFPVAGGITFGSDTAAANALDDYEEGTWQPSYTTSSGSITAHASYSLCRYTKIGRVVQIQGLVSTSAVSSPSGSVKMYGLPFTVDNNTSGEDSGAAAIAVANIVDFASSLHMLTINPQTGGTYLNLTEFNGTSTNSSIANRWQQDTYFRFSGTYTTN